PGLHLLERAGLEARNLGDGRWVVVGQARWPVDGARAAWEIAHALGPRAEAAHAFLSDEAVGAEPPLAIEESGVTCNPALATLLSLGAELTESEAPARTPFTGRRREIAALAGSLARCRSRGEAAVVALSGEPGIGKTRLLARFCEQLAAAAKPPRVLCASTTSFDRDLPFSCLARLWAHAAGLDATASPGDVASALPKLTGWRSGDLATRHVAQGFFAERLRPEHGLRPLHRQALAARKEVGRAFLTWCDELTRDQPLVLALDLARGIDSASREVLRRVVQTFARRPLLLVVANRRGSSLGLEPQLRLELQPLRGREADDLARALALPTPPPEMSGHPWLLEVAALGARRHTPRAP
ncbi:MAG: AAA family ATPase, partial [Polyangiaceae bacterium]